MKKRVFYLDPYRLLCYGTGYEQHLETVADALLMGEGAFTLLYPDVSDISEVYRNISVTEGDPHPKNRDGVPIRHNCYWSPARKEWVSLFN